MKILKDLTNYLQTPNNRFDEKDIPKLRDVLIDSLCEVKRTGQGSGIFNIKAWRLAERLISVDALSIEDAEFEFLVQIVESNPAGYYGWAHAQTMLKLLEFESNGS